MYFVGNEIDLFYEKALKYQHHTENYKESLAQDITPFGLQSKKKTAIGAISPDFDNQWNKEYWNNGLKDAERKLLKLLLKVINKILDEANKIFDEQVEVLCPHVQQRNLKYKKSLEERCRRKWLKFRRRVIKVKKQRKEVLVSDLVEKALQENQNKQNNVLSSSRKKKLRRRAMVFEQQGIPLIENKATIVYSLKENETILSSTSFIRTVKDKVSFISKTRS